MGSHQSKQKNKSAQLASPTFSQHFPTQVSPHYIHLDPIYYVPLQYHKQTISRQLKFIWEFLQHFQNSLTSINLKFFIQFLNQFILLLNTRATTAKSVNRGKHAGTWYGKSIPPPSDYKKPNKATLRHSV